MNLGGRLKLARDQRGLTQDQLAEKVPGANQAMISALESRDSETTTLLFGFADALTVDARWLQTGDGSSGLDRPAVAAPDPLLKQVIELWQHLGPDNRDTLLSNAKWLRAQERAAAPAVQSEAKAQR